MNTQTPAVDAVISPRRRQVLLGAAAGIGLAGCQRFEAGAPDVARISGTTMGGAYTVKLVAPDHDLAAVRSAVQGALDAVDWRMSLFRPDSELAAFNRARAGEPFALSDEMHRVFAAALAVSRQTDGAFDMTVAPLVERWGFGTTPNRRVPAPAALVEARAWTGWQSLKLDEATRTVTKTRADVHADLGGIAKGHGVDRAAATLDAFGIGHYMIEVGGEVRTRGANGAGAPSAHRHRGARRDAAARAPRRCVSGRAMATSGDYRNYFEQDGRRFRTRSTRPPGPRSPRRAVLGHGGGGRLHAGRCARHGVDRAGPAARPGAGRGRGHRGAVHRADRARAVPRSRHCGLCRARRADGNVTATTLATVFVLTAVLIGAAVLAMAVGVLFRRPCLRGSCGGPAVIGPDGEKISCSGCPNKDKHAAG